MIRRGPRPADRFVMIANEALENSGLTWRARGVLAYLLSRPEGWSTSAERLASMSPKGQEGRDSMRAVLTELESAGYVRREKAQDARGRWSTTLVVYDFPEPSVQADQSAETSPEPPIVAAKRVSKKAADPPIVESAKNGGSPGVGQPAVGQPAVGQPGPFNKTDTKTEIKTPPPSSETKSARHLPAPKPDYSTAEDKELMAKLVKWPGSKYLALAGSRHDWLTVKKAWELTQKYLEEVKAKGWNYSEDGWLKFMEKEDEARERRTRGRAYSPDGVPL